MCFFSSCFPFFSKKCGISTTVIPSSEVSYNDVIVSIQPTPSNKELTSSVVTQECVDPQPPSIIIPKELLNISNLIVKAKFKKFCYDNNLCMRCSYSNPNNPTILIFNGILYECPNCDSDCDSNSD
jgi:hypothetical protein